MSTHADAARVYQDAVNHLLAVRIARRSTPEQKAAAVAAIDDLNRAWIDDVQARYQARTASLNVLIERLNGVVAGIETGPLDALREKLEKVVQRARKVLHATAREALSEVSEGLGPDDPDAVTPVAPPPADAEPPSPGAAREDTTADSAPPPPRPSLPPLSPPAAARRSLSSVPGDLYEDYARLFETCLVRPDCNAKVNGHVQRLLSLRDRYEAVGGPLGVPWWFVGVIHGLETSYRFDRHLHNGDPLAAATVRVPAGRPPGWVGAVDQSWEASARDALTLKGFDEWSDWAPPGALYQWERYNGFGYRKYHPQVNSPYLWSFSNHYRKGKYVADGRFDPEAVSAQCGAAATLRTLVNRGHA